jgi:hypothetical protein
LSFRFEYIFVLQLEMAALHYLISQGEFEYTKNLRIETEVSLTCLILTSSLNLCSVFLSCLQTICSDFSFFPNFSAIPEAKRDFPATLDWPQKYLHDIHATPDSASRIGYENPSLRILSSTKYTLGMIDHFWTTIPHGHAERSSVQRTLGWSDAFWESLDNAFNPYYHHDLRHGNVQELAELPICSPS